MNIKEEAKEIYFSEVKVPEWRESFEKRLATYKLFDKRDEGYYCMYCGDIKKTPEAFYHKNKVVFPTRHNNEIWIVNSHYDGCRGWD